MKLNATVEMQPVTWPETCNMHPFAPTDQTTGKKTYVYYLIVLCYAFYVFYYSAALCFLKLCFLLSSEVISTLFVFSPTYDPTSFFSYCSLLLSYCYTISLYYIFSPSYHSNTPLSHDIRIHGDDHKSKQRSS